jgi:hypothetical protein
MMAESITTQPDLNKDNILDILNEPDDDKISLDEDKGKEKEDDGKEIEVKKDEKEDDELKQLEEELEEPDESKLELETPVPRREILKKYPTLFKEFPYLEKAYYREQQYTELLPTIDDAKLAVEKSGTLDKFQEELMSGSVEGVLKAVKETDNNAFYKIADNYLPTLARVDEKAYYTILGNIIKNTVSHMFREGDRINNDTLKNAAAIVNQFVFGTSDYNPPVNLSGNGRDPKYDEQENRIKQQQEQFTKQRFETTRDDLSNRVETTLKSTIEAYIDPKESMSSYVRKTAGRDAMENLQSLLDGDSRLRTILDKMWEKAFQDNFSKTSIDRIKSAYLSKAKTLLPAVIKKARTEALKGSGRRVVEEEETDVVEEVEERPTRRAIRTSPQSSKKEIPAGMSTLDYFNKE